MTLHRTNSCSAAQRDAFTLIEVLATLVVISIVMPVVMKGLSLAVAASSQSRRSVEAATLADLKLQDIITSGDWANGSMSGDFSPDWPDYRWTAESVSRDTDLMEMQVKVIWTARGRERSVTVSTLLYTGLTDDTGDASGTGTGGLP